MVTMQLDLRDIQILIPDQLKNADVIKYEYCKLLIVIPDQLKNADVMNVTKY